MGRKSNAEAAASRLSPSFKATRARGSRIQTQDCPDPQLQGGRHKADIPCNMRAYVYNPRSVLEKRAEVEPHSGEKGQACKRISALRPNPHWAHRRKRRQIKLAGADGSVHTGRKQHQGNCLQIACKLLAVSADCSEGSYWPQICHHSKLEQTNCH